MGKEYTVQEALKLAIQAEKDSMDFYRRAAAVTKNERARKVLELLANEEVGHLKSFFDHYKGGEFGDLRSYMESPPNKKMPFFLPWKRLSTRIPTNRKRSKSPSRKRRPALNSTPCWPRISSIPW
nr:ferritin family protein [Geotalea toluenoxydans]